MKGSITLLEALEGKLSQLKQPAITDYQLGVMVFNLYRTGRYKEKRLNTKLKIPSYRAYTGSLRDLVDTGILKPIKTIPHTYFIFGKETFREEELICSVDPFAYISHLSAMEYHGFTDRIPRVLFYSSPAQKKWREFAIEKMRADFQNESDIDLPKLSLKKIEKVKNKVVNRYSSVHLGAYIRAGSTNFRVSSIGRTFLDMLRKPELCGGMYHVINVYEDFAELNLGRIVDEVDANGTQIEKVRAGYILEEICGLTHKTINDWIQFVQRGGSRKLDPNEDYAPEFSERWCISINIEI